MYIKTTSANFLKFGYINDGFTKQSLSFERFITDNKGISLLKSYDSTVYIKPLEGMAMLVVADNPETDKLNFFAIHRNIAIHKGKYFTIIPMTTVACYDIYYDSHCNIKEYRLTSTRYFENIKLKTRVENIVAYYYVVKGPNYIFPGETHYLYELTYVDNGILETTIQDTTYTINANQCIFYGPGQSHNQVVAGTESCSYLTVIFEASGIDNSKLLNKIFNINKETKSIIENFVRNTNNDNPYSEDMLIVSLNDLLLKLLQSTAQHKTQDKINIPITQHFQTTFLEEIVTYIHENIYRPLTVEAISQEFSISRTYLQRIFNENLHTTPKAYINDIKLARSKILIKKGQHSFSEIADMLCYSSIHYFSRIFSAKFGVTPSEYAKKIYT